MQGQARAQKIKHLPVTSLQRKSQKNAGGNPPSRVLHIAPFIFRFAAFSIDATIVGFITACISILFFDGSLLQLLIPQASYSAEQISITSLEAAYHILAIALFGKTVGKSWVGIRVVSIIDGSPPSFRQSVMRHLPYILLGLASALYLSQHPNEPLTFYSAASQVGHFAEESGQLFYIFTNPAYWTLDAWMWEGHPLRRILVQSISGNPLIIIGIIWLSSSVAILPFNRNRRTLHDYIAQTAVVVGRR